ncbi:MAG: hypothetical protein EXS13_06300 [Planctomycetes bacterium]|nr:hypothetical protein [Planctomycetota bacterium]
MKFIHVTLPSLSFVVLLAGHARAQLPGPTLTGQEFGYFGMRMVDVGDLNGDGCAELAIAEQGWDAPGVATVGRVTLVDGASGTVLRTHDGANFEDRLGSSIAALGDWDGDGVNDYAIGVPGTDTSRPDVGSIMIVSGVTGATFVTLFGTTTQTMIGYEMAGIGDADGDGIGDLLVSMYLLGDARIYFSSGASYQQIPGSSSSKFGVVVARLGDLDGDSIDEFAISETGWDPGYPDINRGRVHVYSGATITRIGTVAGLQSGDAFGNAIARLGDLDGDGVSDFAASASGANYAFIGRTGYVQIVSGATLLPLFVIGGAASDDQLGVAICGMADLNHDAIDDFAVTSVNGGAQDLGLVEVRSGRDASVLWTIEGVANSTSANVNFGSLAGGDWNGDGVGDLAVGDLLFSVFDPVTATWLYPGQVALWLGAPAFSESYGAGWPGTNGIPSLDAVNDPGFGQTLDVAIGNSAGVTTLALLLVGTAPAAIPVKDGTLLVVADFFSTYLLLPAGGTTLSEDIPDDPALAFVDLYMQVLEADFGASRRVAFTPGLRLRFGFDVP